ncbi:MAG TPA: serine hydrolase domain-containing protein [Anaerolineae bacterium]|nr:serine hydrolase domain-containing protein [Anaerolineae bacterium]
MSANHELLWDKLLAFVAEVLEKRGVPGAVVGIMHEGETQAAGVGVTNVDHPLPVTAETLFQIGSITKTFTATAMMRLVEMGKLDLDVTVRTYVPAFKVADESASARATIRHLLTHMAGWFGDYFHDTGMGDDALAQYVTDMADLEQVMPLNAAWSYNNAAFYLAGYIIEAVTGQRYEAALKELLLEPLDLEQIFFDPGDVMTYRFAVGHRMGDEGVEVARPWPLPRAAYPVGGITCSVYDLLRFAGFHTGDGTLEDGTRLLTPESLSEMQSPQATIWEDETIGLSWFLNDVAGTRLVSHGGGTKGQVSQLTLAPEHDFAVAVFTNADQGGFVTDDVVNWALKHYLAIENPKPEAIETAEETLVAYVGRYDNPFTGIDVGLLGGKLVAQVVQKRGFPTEDTPIPPPPPPMSIAPCGDDQLLVVDGPFKGGIVYAGREQDGSVGWVRMSGRICVRQG